MHVRAIKTWAEGVSGSAVAAQTRIRRNATTAMTNITAASMARINNSSDTVGVTALNRPARKMSVVYVNGLARLATWIGEGAALAGKNTDEVKRKMKNADVETIWNVSDDSRLPDGLPGESAYSFRASLAFGRSSLLPHLRQRVARIAFRA